MNNEDEIIRLTYLDSAQDAYLLKNMLENCGIESFLVGENFNALFPGVSNGLGSSIQIMIHKADFKQSYEVLRLFMAKDSLSCPKCGSLNIGQDYGKFGRLKAFFFYFVLLLGLGINGTKNRNYCKDCGNKF